MTILYLIPVRLIYREHETIPEVFIPPKLKVKIKQNVETTQ